jgi:hypothetical protein
MIKKGVQCTINGVRRRKSINIDLLTENNYELDNYVRNFLEEYYPERLV